MATSIQLAERFAALFSARVSTCTNTYKRLQAADLVSRGGRGRNAAHITAHDAVMLMLGLIGSEHINDAPDAARRYAELQAKGRHAEGDYADDRNFWETQWYAMAAIYPALGSLPASHNVGQAVTTLIEAYAEQTPPAFDSTIAVTIRGPMVSATIRFEDPKGVEQIDYGPSNGKDMFRTIIGNPNRDEDQVRNLSNYLHVEKRITADTIKEIGALLRE